MKKLLFVGDFACTTGFGRVNQCLAERLDEQFDWYILGINTPVDHNRFQRRFKLYPASASGDIYGYGRVAALVEAIRPDVMFVHLDSWNVSIYREALEMAGVPVPPTVAYCPPDGGNQWKAYLLNSAAHVVTPTEFGMQELRKGGYEGPGSVVPYGTDTSIYFPQDQTEMRKVRNFPEAAKFIFGRADRNAERKRYDLTFMAFKQFLETTKADDVYLHCHCVVNDEAGWRLVQLAQHFGIVKQVLFTDAHLQAGNLLKEEILAQLYNVWDAHISTCRGEGFGLVAMESAACGIPQVLPNNAAYSEVFKDAARMIPVSVESVTPRGSNTVGSVPSVEAAALAMEEVWSNASYREGLARQAYLRATETRFNWDVIARQIGAILAEAAERPAEKPAEEKKGVG